MTIKTDSIFSFHQMGQRDNQEDSRWPDADRPSGASAAFAVCDGVGGSSKGEVASAAVCNRIGEIMASHSASDPFSDGDFARLLSQCYGALDEASDESNRGMGTTLTFLAFHNGGALAAHIGDSRIYQIRPSEGIIYRSEDHSLVNALLRSGNIAPEEVRNHPRRNVITRCMNANDGVRERDEATVVNLRDIKPGDYFLLCSDGVTGDMEDEELIALYASPKSDEEKWRLLAEKSKDSSDNNTAIQIHIGNVEGAEEEAPENPEETPATDTKKLPRIDDGVHDLSPLTEKKASGLKSFLSRLFG